MPIIGEQIIKEFGSPPQRVLHGIDLKIEDGEFVSISGRSGSGKSTLLYLISTLDLPSQGRVIIDGHDIAAMKSADLHHFRNKHVGFIFQFHFLLPELKTIENILLGPRNLGLEKQYKTKAYELLERLEILEQAEKLPSQMSGGQQQRVAIARALILNPRYLFADEPTGNLDSTTANSVMELLKQINKEDGTTIILVTHEPDFSKMADREIFLVDGQVQAT